MLATPGMHTIRRTFITTHLHATSRCPSLLAVPTVILLTSVVVLSTSYLISFILSRRNLSCSVCSPPAREAISIAADIPQILAPLILRRCMLSRRVVSDLPNRHQRKLRCGFAWALHGAYIPLNTVCPNVDLLFSNDMPSRRVSSKRPTLYRVMGGARVVLSDERDVRPYHQFPRRVGGPSVVHVSSAKHVLVRAMFSPTTPHSCGNGAPPPL